MKFALKEYVILALFITLITWAASSLDDQPALMLNSHEKRMTDRDLIRHEAQRLTRFCENNPDACY